MVATTKRTVWTPEQVAILQENYLSRGAAYVAEQTGHSHDAVRNKANTLGLKARSGTGHWSEEELKQMRELYPTLGVAGMARLLGRSIAGVAGYARKLKLYRLTTAGPRNRIIDWSEADLELLRREYPANGPGHVASLLPGRTKGAVLGMARRLGIRCGIIGRGRAPWSEEHLALLRQHYPTSMPLVELSQLLGRQVATIEAMASRLKIRRPVRVKAQPAPKLPRVKAAPAPKPAKPKPAPAPKPAPVAKVKPAPKPKKPVLSEEEKALKKLVRQKAQAKKEKKKKQEQPKKWWQYPMHSAEYKAGFDATTAGRKATTILDENGRTATVWRKAA